MTAVRDRRPVARTIIVDSGSGASLALRLQATFDSGSRNVVVDLGDAEMVDSWTLTALRRFGGPLRQAGGQLSVVCSNSRLANLLDLTLLSRSFTVFRTLDAALEAAAPMRAEAVGGSRLG